MNLVDTKKYMEIMAAWNGKFEKESNIYYRYKAEFSTWKELHVNHDWNFREFTYHILQGKLSPITKEDVLKLIGDRFERNNKTYLIIGYETSVVGPSLGWMIVREIYTDDYTVLDLIEISSEKIVTSSGAVLYKQTFDV